MPAYDIERLKQRIAGIRFEDNAALVRQKSRDFYWYSPVLKRQLDAVTGDIIVAPANETELTQVMAACFELQIPLTPRGGGTGNYGQAMPLSGGVVLDLSGMKQVTKVAPGRVVAEPGAILASVDQQTRRQSGQELRLHPSTYHTASIGGYVAGGSGGVGSIRWGGLRDCGNIIRLKVATMEASPRLLDLAGDDLQKVAHAYGTNGIITEVEMPLAPAYEWIDLIAGFPTLRDAMLYANALGEQDGLLLKNVAVVAGAGRARFLRALSAIPASRSSRRDRHRRRARARRLARLHAPSSPRGNPVPERPGAGSGPQGSAGRLRAYVEPHHAARTAPDPAITYLQSLYPFPHQNELVERIHARFGAELPAHLEFVRIDGKVTVWACRSCASRPRSGSMRSCAFTRRWARRSSIPIATRWRKAA